LDEDVNKKIREEYKIGGVTQHQLAEKYQVSRSYIKRLVNNEIFIDPDYIYEKRNYKTGDLKECNC
jgi:predicted transcriptional regulator